MSTPEDLDTDLAAAIIAQTQQTQRMRSDHLVSSGERIPDGAFRFRQIVDVLNRPSQSSSRSGYVCVAQVTWMVKMEVSGLDVDESVYRPGAWLDQQTLTDGNNDGFWNSLPSVKTIVAGTLPEVIEGLDRTGRVLKFQVTANIELVP